MPGDGSLWKILIYIGVILIVIGGVFGLVGRFSRSGRLPGDIYVRRGNFTLYFPLATCLLVSLVLTLISWVLRRR